MKLFICDDHDCIWPVGVASIVWAKDKPQAKRLLDKQLMRCNLEPYKKSPYTLKEVSLLKPVAIVIRTGDY